MRGWAVSALVVLVLAGAFFVFSAHNQPQKPASIKIGEHELVVEIADEAAEQVRGLSGRETLAEGRGMLFVYDKPAVRSFWMKDMQFSIDIMWIGENKKVVGIEHAVSPNTYPQTFSPPVPVQYVLEVPAGWAEKNNIRKEDPLML